MPQHSLEYDDRALSGHIDEKEREAYREPLAEAERLLVEKRGAGNDYLGWLELPTRQPADLLNEVVRTASHLREKADTMVCIGIGGSYLGTRAAVELLGPSFDDLRSPKILFAGHHLNSDYLSDLLKVLENREVTLNVISKSGTTTEPGVAFRVLRQWMEQRYGTEEAAARIVATTDPDKGALRNLARQEGYATLPIPPDIGGRFSVLTAVGLFPMAFAGINIEDLLSGAAEAAKQCTGAELEANPAARYAVNRNILFRRGLVIEVMATFQPHLHYLGEWWKQLAGESEGKQLTGLFPTVLDYTTDLHSVGQWMQEGLRNVFETLLVLSSTRKSLSVPAFSDNEDGLNYLAGKSLEEINNQACNGTLLAHLDGGVPVSTIRLADRTERSLGHFFYFFEKAIALSGYLLRVNPFNQPGVEAYKKNMFALLGKPGFEERFDELNRKMKGMGL